MSKLVTGVSEDNVAGYLRRMNRLKRLTGTELLNELVAYDPTRASEYGTLHGRQNKRKGTAWKKAHVKARESRRRNRGTKRR